MREMAVLARAPRLVGRVDSEVAQVSVSPDGTLVAATGCNSHFKMWLARDCAALEPGMAQAVPKPVRVASNECVHFAFAPTNHILGTNLETRVIVSTHLGMRCGQVCDSADSVSCLAWSSDGSFAVTCACNSCVALYYSDGSGWPLELGWMGTGAQDRIYPRALAIAPDCRHFCLLGHDSLVIMTPGAWGEQGREAPQPVSHVHLESRFDEPLDLENPPSQVAFSSSDALVVLTGPRFVAALTVPDATEVWLRRFSELPRALAVSGSTVAVGLGNDIHLLMLSTGSSVGILSKHTETVTSLAYTPTGDLVSGGSDRKVLFWAK